MNDETKQKMAEAGVKAGASLFARMMDRFARKPLFKAALVRGFRRVFGRISPEQLEDEVTPIVNKALDRKRKTK